MCLPNIFVLYTPFPQSSLAKNEEPHQFFYSIQCYIFISILRDNILYIDCEKSGVPKKCVSVIKQFSGFGHVRMEQFGS